MCISDRHARVRTDLNVNCAMCHVNDGGGNSKLKFGIKTPLEEANLIGELPLHDTMGLDDARIVVPGHPERSILYTRVTARGMNQMPPTSSNRVDERGAQLLFDWTKQLEVKAASAAE